MKLELRYDNPSPTCYGDDEPIEWYYNGGTFDTYQELLQTVIHRWNWRAFYRLYIEFADDELHTKEEKDALNTLNETFRRDLMEVEKKKQQYEKMGK